MKRRALSLFAALTAWVGGAALGSPAVPHAVAFPVFTLGKAHPAEFVPSLTGSKPIFILALGSDARPGESVARSRSDSIHIIGINPAKHAASILGFPRDSYVDIAGHGKNKINTAMTYGGPPMTVRTIESITGIHLDYYLLTSFVGLKNMVQGVGGITVKVLVPMHDPYSHSNFDPGVQHLSGSEALAFARDRHSFPNGDLDRSENQGRLMVAGLMQFRKEFKKDPSRLLTYLGAGLRNVKTDLPFDEVLNLGFTADSVTASKIKNMVVPAVGAVIGGSDVVIIQPGAQDLYKDMKDDGLLNGSLGKGKG